MRLVKAALSIILTDGVELNGLLFAVSSRKKRNKVGLARPSSCDDDETAGCLLNSCGSAGREGSRSLLACA